MTFHNSITSTQDPTLGDVLAWAKSVGESRDAILELEKVPARMGMADDDIGLIPADLSHFEKVIAKTPYGMVSNSGNLPASQRRGNSRVRAILGRFHAARGIAKPVGVSATYDAAIEAVKAREGFTDEGADFPTSTHKSLFTLRSRCRVPLPALDQVEVDRVFCEATVEKRRSLRRAINLLNALRRGHNRWPEIAPHLPAVDLSVPKGSDRAERILWSTLPESFRDEVGGVFREVLLTPDDLASWIKNQMALGRSSNEINEQVNMRVKGRGRRPRNSTSAVAGYQGAVTWLVRRHKQRNGTTEDLPCLRDLMNRPLITDAIEDQIARSEASLSLKDPKKSQTLANRLTNLRTLARHGLRDSEIVAHLDLLKVAYHEYIVTPKEMTEEADHTCRTLQLRPDLAARFVNAPAELAREAEEAIAAARAADDGEAEDAALRLYASAVLHAIQVSRPLRTSNLIAARHRGSPEIAGNLKWVKKVAHAELRFLKGEIKNDATVTVHVVDDDARILWTWMETHRKRFIELRSLSDSPYVFPGLARPRFVKDAIELPEGCMAPATMAEIWALGAERIGLGISPHACRHAVATLILAVEPGNFAKAAAVLGDVEETVRRHYGRDSGEQAAKAVRAALLARHPDIFKRMKGRLS